MSLRKVMPITKIRSTCELTLCFVILFGFFNTAVAATFVVDSTADGVDLTPGDSLCATASAQCTLRAAIQESNALFGADTVTVPAGTYTLAIAGSGEDAAATGDLDITEDIVINGSAASPTIIDANAVDRVVDILGANVTGSNLTIRNGSVPVNGGGIRVDSSGFLTLSSSTISGNTASGVNDGGGVHASGNSDFINVTFSGNTAERGGGMSCTAICTLTNATVTANTAVSQGGGIHQGGGAGTSITFLNTIVANNSAPLNQDCDGPAARLISNGYNLSSDATCDFTGTGDQENTNPLLGPLQDNGGPTFTHALLVGSPAIEAGTNAGCPATDQRGTARPLGTTCDVGSYEAVAPLICTVTTTADAGPNSLRDCISFANSNPGTTIPFNIPGPGNRSSGGDSWWAISPASQLPTIIAAGTAIDGTTQTANQGDTNSIGPEIELDGTSAGGGSHGLVIGSAGDASTIRGLMINRFLANGVQVQSGANTLTIAGNFIGSDGSGASAPGNGNNGINLLGANATIGGTGTSDRNVINNNGNEGINLSGGGATGNNILGNYIGLEYDGVTGGGNNDVGIAILSGASGTTVGGLTPASRNVISMNFEGMEINTANNVVVGNYIGTDAGGTLDRGNRSDDGLEIQAGGNANTIGGIAAGAANRIAFNQLHGINIAAGTSNSILGNQIYGNVALDLDLNDDGVTLNDPLDADGDPNDQLNYPEIVTATEIGAIITAYFNLDVPVGDYRIEFFTNPSGTHVSGNGGGEVFAGATTITSAGAGVELFAFSFAGFAGDVITTTATEELAGPTYASTSEFSIPVTALAGTPFEARWPLDETSGLIAADVLAGNDGAYRNGVLLNQFAACANTGNGVYFDGIDDYVEVPHSPDYVMDEGTATLWVNIDAIGAEQAIFSKDHLNFGTGGHLTLSVQSGGDLQTRLQSTTASMYVNTAPVGAGTWIHVAFSWGAGGMAMYVDGGAPATNPYVGGLGATSGDVGNSEPIAFGSSTVVSGAGIVTPLENYFRGFMDDVRIYNRALTLPEIQALAGCTPAPNLNLVKRAFWPDGTPIPTGATIPSGVEFRYLLYINNQVIAQNDLSIRDVLDPAFQYQAGTIQIDNSIAECGAAVCTPAEEQAIFAAIDATPILTDAVDGDVASYTGAGTVIDAGDGTAPNAQLNINGDAVWAILFSVKMP